jgi:hypothetical protein
MPRSLLRCRAFPAWATLAWAVALALAAVPAPAEVCAATSGPQTVALVELYTSEGCSSCPPADRWLSATVPVGAAGASAIAIALAFHVDYWDRLGWKDRFAAPAWTERQYAMARANRSSLVYTPQVLVQGHDVPDWHGNGGIGAIATVADHPARAHIALEAQALHGAVAVNATARVPATGDRRNAALFVALTDSRLVSEVKAGENAGARLTHDHVVRALRDVMAVGTDGDAAGTLTLPLPSEAGAAPTVVAFVQNTVTGDVLQALALPLLPNTCAAAR